MNENLKAFLKKASEDETLKVKLTEISDSIMRDAKEKFVKLAEENGFTFTEEDVDSVTAEKEKLSEDELNATTGGMYTEIHAGKRYTGCLCTLSGGGDSDSIQKTCICVLGGCGELTKYGKKLADNDEIWYSGAKGAKVALWCAVSGMVWETK